jgi:putative transposase
MARVQFIAGTRYERNHQMYLIQGTLPEGRLLVENLTMGREERPALHDLIDAWAQKDIIFVPPTRLAAKTSAGQIATRYTIADFQGLPPQYKEEAWRRYQLLLPLLKMPRWERTRMAIKAYANTLKATYPSRPDHKRSRIGQAASRTSLERWLRYFEESGYDIRALVPGFSQRKDQGKSHLDSDVEHLIEATLKECKENPAHRTLEGVYLMVVNKVAELNRYRPADQQAEPPGLSTLYERIQVAGPAAILRRRASRLEAQSAQPYLPGPHPTRILERVEIDSTKLDLFVVDEEDRFPIGRPTLTYALDVYSGFPLGVYVGFEPHSYRSVMNCLLHAILPKVDARKEYGTKHQWIAFGLPETLIVDNDRPFVNQHIKDACGQLGIHHEQMPVETPWFKGSIERFFRTNNTGLIHGLPGSSFSNVVKRGDYDAIEHACISLKEFWRLLHVFLLDYYAQEKHTKLGIIPAHRWNESLQAGFLPYFHTSAEEAQIILYCTTLRTVGRNGIDFEALRYQSTDAQRLRKNLSDEQPSDSDDNDEEPSELPNRKRIPIKYDPADISKVYIFDSRQQKWIPIPAVDPTGYTQGLSLWKHRIVRRYLLHKNQPVDIYALAEALEHIHQIVEEAYNRTRRTRTRSEAARFLEIGTDPLPVPTTIPDAVPQIEISKASDKKVLPEPQATPMIASPATENTEASPPKANQTEEQATPVATSAQARPTRLKKTKVTSQETVSSPAPTTLDLSDWGADYDLPIRK